MAVGYPHRGRKKFVLKECLFYRSDGKGPGWDAASASFCLGAGLIDLEAVADGFSIRRQKQ
jgi:hypothetical protein